MKKKTGIKIKKSKHNLYNKKKLKSRQTLTIVLTIVAACVLAVVGYGIGKPIVNYFQNKNSESSDSASDSSSPQNSSNSVSEDPSSQSDSSQSASASDSGTHIDPVVGDVKMYFLPLGAADSSAALGSALAAAKDAGYNTVAVTLKDEEGYLYYATNINKVKNTTLVKGTLTAEQISTQIKNAGLTPAAKISMLRDAATPMYFGGYTFTDGGGWLDDSPDKGGKRWLSPFSDETPKYLGDIAAELSGAGFEHIICSHICYPIFHQVDINDFLSHLPLNDKNARIEALWNVTDAVKSAAEKNNAKLWVEMDGADFIKNDRYSTDAELAANAGKLGTVSVIIDYTQSGTEQVYENARSFAEKLISQSATEDIAVLVKRGMSGSISADISRAFEENEIDIFVGN